MTGHQDNPLTGKTIRGEASPMIDLEALCRAVGVKNVRVEDPFDLEGMKKALREETEKEEPSVIIARRPCALLKGVKYEGKKKVDLEKCKSCKMCLKIGCPAISLKDGNITIDSSQCNGCGYCQNICKFGALSKEVE